MSKKIINTDIFVNIARANSSEKQCVICKRKRGKRKILKRLSNKAIIESYVKTGIMIQFGCRACLHHFNDSGFFNEQRFFKTSEK